MLHPRLQAALLLAGVACTASFSTHSTVGQTTCSGFTLVTNTGLSAGTSLADANETSLKGCCDLCHNHSKCRAFSYHNPGHHSALKCSLWSLVSLPGHVSEGTTSGYLAPGPPPPPPTLPPIPPVQPPLGFQPNIVLIQTDDQDVEIGGVEPMHKLQRLLAAEGATMRHFYVNTPVCCPSRTETLSGRYHHNMRDRNGPEWQRYGCGDEPVGKPHECGCMRMNCSATFEGTTYADYLQAAGYKTAYFGKYLNPPAMDPFCHNTSTPVPGWDDFFGMCVTAYYDIPWVNSAGNLVHTGSSPAEYSTSIVGNKTVQFIRDSAESARQSGPGRHPFFVSAATRAPHGPATPAPWYKDAFPGLRAPRTPAFGVQAEGHVGWIADQPPYTAHELAGIDGAYANRWRTLLSVDDIVEAVVRALEEEGLLDQTFVFYTSDHGYHLGQFRLGSGKTHFYEFDSRVPVFVRGPGIAPNSTIDRVAGNVDFAPTFLDLAGVADILRPMDGRSLLPLLRPDLAPAVSQPGPWRNAFLIEFSGLNGWGGAGKRINDCPNNTYRGLRFVDPSEGEGSVLANSVFAEYTTVSDYDYREVNFRELYNLNQDPFQLHNLWPALSEANQSTILRRVADAWACKGDSCRTTDMRAIHSPGVPVGP